MDDPIRLTADQKAEWLTEAREDFDRAYIAEQDMRRDMIDDLEFSWGDQWPDYVKAERERDNRPCMTIDRLGDTIRKGMATIRKNRPSIKVIPVDSEGDRDTAEIYTDLIRSIEYASGGSRPYLWASEMAMRAGYGVFEICQVENDGDVWAQDLRLKRIVNPLTCYFDPDATESTKGDARFAFKSSWMTEKAFKDKYPNAAAQGFNDNTRGERWERWYSDKDIRVAKCWKKRELKKSLLLLEDGRTVYEDQLTDEDGALKVMRDREVTTHEVVRFIMSANEILEGPYLWPGKLIPLIPVYGEEINLEGRRSYRGITRTAKDPQRLLNYARTTQAEILMQQPKTPWVVGTSQITDKLKQFWAKANSAKLPYLPFDDSTNPNPPTRQPPPVTSTGYLQESIQAGDDLQRATGFFDPSLGAPSNETSGRAVLARQLGSDEGSMVFADNLAASLEQAGRVLVELIPHFYDTDRVLRLYGEDGSEREVEVNRETFEFDGETIQRSVQNDLRRGRFDVRVITGPGYQTKRLESADSMMNFLRFFPAAAPLVGDLVAKSQDWPSAEEFAERLKSLVPPGVIEEEDPEKLEAQQQQMQVQMQQLALAMQKEQAELEKLQSETVENVADAKLKNLKAVEIQQMLESGLLQAEKLVELQSKRAKAALDSKEAEAQEIESMLVTSGVMDLLGGGNGTPG